MDYLTSNTVTGGVSDQIKIVALSGSFDRSNADSIRQKLIQVTAKPPALVIVNLSRVDFIDSTGLATLVYGVKQARLMKGDLRLCGLKSSTRIIFELTRMDKVFEIFLTEQDAIHSFGLTEN